MKKLSNTETTLTLVDISNIIKTLFSEQDTNYLAGYDVPENYDYEGNRCDNWLYPNVVEPILNDTTCDDDIILHFINSDIEQEDMKSVLTILGFDYSTLETLKNN